MQWGSWRCHGLCTPASGGRGTLLTCGDVETNPGPREGKAGRQRRPPPAPPNSPAAQTPRRGLVGHLSDDDDDFLNAPGGVWADRDISSQPTPSNNTAAGGIWQGTVLGGPVRPLSPHVGEDPLRTCLAAGLEAGDVDMGVVSCDPEPLRQVGNDLSIVMGLLGAGMSFGDLCALAPDLLAGETTADNSAPPRVLDGSADGAATIVGQVPWLAYRRRPRPHQPQDGLGGGRQRTPHRTDLP